MAWQLEAIPVIRHSASTFWALGQLMRWRPSAIFLQHSFLLALTVASYQRLVPWPVTVVDDVHTKALRRRPGGPAGRLFERLLKWSVSGFEYVLVATPTLEAEARKLGRPVLVVEDPIPDIAASRGDAVAGVGPVVVICSYATDEPVQELLAAASLLPHLDFTFTGLPPAELVEAVDVPNVSFTGFLPRPEYEDLLTECQCAVVLTRDNDCLLSGGVEALGARRPLVTSDTTALRRYFGDAAVYVAPDDPRSIAAGLRKAIESADELVARGAKTRRERRWRQEKQMEVLRAWGRLPPPARS